MIITNNIDIEKLCNKYEKERKNNGSNNTPNPLYDFQCFLNELYNSTTQSATPSS